MSVDFDKYYLLKKHTKKSIMLIIDIIIYIFSSKVIPRKFLFF